MAPLTGELRKRVLGKATNARLERFLRESIRPFKAPTHVSAWSRRAERLRDEVLWQVYLRGHRRSLLRNPPRVVWGPTLRPHPDYRIRKLRYEAYPGYWVPALLYVPIRPGAKVPAVLNPNGHHRGGKAADYKQARCINLAKRGMYALNFEFIGMGQLEADTNHDEFAYLDLTGVAGVGLFYLAMKKGLDVLLAQPRVDRRRVCMTGLSGGGWQTIVLSALDPRITVCVPVAGYTAVRARVGCWRDVGDLEQNPVDLTTVLDYQDLTAMVAPRPTLQLLNQKDDCCFRTARARPIIYDAVRPTFRAFGALDHFRVHSNRDPGTHNYGADHRSQLYQFLNEHFGLSTPPEDLPFEQELYEESQLNVDMPHDQLTVRDLARGRMAILCRKHRTPRTAAQRRELRRRLVKVLRLPRYESRSRLVSGTRRCGTWLVSAGPWQIPITGTFAKNGHEAILSIADHGRRGFRPGDEGQARFFADILGSGENSGDLRHLLMIDCAGHRLLGIRVAQILASSAFVAHKMGTKRVALEGRDLNGSIAAVLAAAIQPRLFSHVTANGLPPSYRCLLDWCLRYDQVQTSLCFGLLEVVDIPQILALMEGVELRQPERAVVPARY